LRYSFITGLFIILLGCGTASAQTDPASSAAQPPDVAMWAAASDNSATSAQAPVERKYRPVHKFAKMARRILSRTSSIAAGLTRSALRFLGTPYVFGGSTAGGFDCSGYVQHVFATIGIRLPRTADAQYYSGARVHGGVAAGDLVFFQTYAPGPSHVGIYLGHGSFVHSSSHGVMVSRMHDSYWAARYIGAKRVASR